MVMESWNGMPRMKWNVTWNVATMEQPCNKYHGPSCHGQLPPCHHRTCQHVNMSSKCHALCQAVLGPNSVRPQQNVQVSHLLMNLTWQSIRQQVLCNDNDMTWHDNLSDNKCCVMTMTWHDMTWQSIRQQVLCNDNDNLMPRNRCLPQTSGYAIDETGAASKVTPITIEHVNMSTCHPSAMPCAKQCWSQTMFGLSRMFK